MLGSSWCLFVSAPDRRPASCRCTSGCRSRTRRCLAVYVSALMSGVMTKVAIYGFVRIVFGLLGEPEWWWAMVVLAIGGGTALIGVLYAVMEQDLKKLLAYSTIENIGIVFVGLGLALAFRANRLDPAAALALTAALMHVVNHALFKSLLFFGAGAVLTATGCRDLDRLGGLIHPHAGDEPCLPRWRGGNLGASAFQRLRLRVADLPGGAAQPADPAMGPQAHDPGRRRAPWRLRRRSPERASCAPSA